MNKIKKNHKRIETPLRVASVNSSSSSSSVKNSALTEGYGLDPNEEKYLDMNEFIVDNTVREIQKFKS